MIFTEYFTLTALTSVFSIIIAAAVYSFLHSYSHCRYRYKYNYRVTIFI